MEADTFNTDNMSLNSNSCDLSHPSALLYNFDVFQSKDILCDVTLIVEEVKIRAHKVVLAAASPFFRLMFTSDMKEASEGTVSLSNIELSVLKAIITYVYTSQISVTEDSVYSLMEAADFLQLPGVLFVCEHYLRTSLSPANCLSVCARARQRHARDLAHHAFQYALDNFGKVVREEEFVHAPPDLLLDVLAARTVCIEDEAQLLQSVVVWVHHDEDQRSSYLEQLLSKLLLHQVSVDTLSRYRSGCELSGRLAAVLRAAIDEVISSVLADKYDGHGPSRGLPGRLQLKRQRYYSHQEVLLGVGGESNGVAVGSVECFTLGYDSWRCIIPTVIHESGTLADSTVVGAMSVPRAHAASACADNMLYMAGGCTQGQPSCSVECYSARCYSWRQLLDLPVAVQGAAAVLVDGRLLVVGGATLTGPVSNSWVLDDPGGSAADAAWKEAVPMTARRAFHGAACVAGAVYALGGVGGSTAGEDRVLRTVERYCPLIGRWQAMAPMHYARSRFGCVSMDEHIYVVGGCTESKWLRSVERYDTLADEWCLLEQMSVPRSDFGMAVCSRRVYCLGGRDGIHRLGTVEKYNPRTDRWHCVTSMQMSRLGLCAATIRVPVVKDCPI